MPENWQNCNWSLADCVQDYLDDSRATAYSGVESVVNAHCPGACFISQGGLSQAEG